MDLLRLQVPPEVRESRVETIGTMVLLASRDMRSANFEAIHDDDLAYMVELYDERFFDRWLLATVREKTGSPLGLRLSSMMTSAGGKTIHYRGRRFVGNHSRLEIAVATHLLLMTFRDVERETFVGGIRCENRLQALQRVVEHEIIHLAEILAWGKSSCSASRFKGLAKNIFGHTKTRHQLVTPREHAAIAHNIHVRQRVTFDFKGVRHTGVVNRIHHRATVLVPSAKGTPYSDGKKYIKYLIPLHHLRPVE